jgi:hypothetical protein
VPQFALSPDGRTLVFVANLAGADPVIWLRSIGQVTARPLPGTESAQLPFWSPDSRWVGFFAEGKLKKIPVAGGAAFRVYPQNEAQYNVPESRDGLPR